MRKLELLSQGFDENQIETILNLRITDNSKPAEDKFCADLTPITGHKTRAAEEIVKQACEWLKINRNR
ncbi:MAG: hypothetical protein NZL96_02160 [Patescibacteria group bacterium]|nr:hypothetical protein [Patescibacteria group bacterium]